MSPHVQRYPEHGQQSIQKHVCCSAVSGSEIQELVGWGAFILVTCRGYGGLKFQRCTNTLKDKAECLEARVSVVDYILVITLFSRAFQTDSRVASILLPCPHDPWASSSHWFPHGVSCLISAPLPPSYHCSSVLSAVFQVGGIRNKFLQIILALLSQK